MKRIALLLSFLWAAVPAAAQDALVAVVDVPAQAHPTIAGAWVDCDALLRKAGIGAPFRPDSVVVRLAEPAGAEALPARVEPANGLYRVFWQAPAAAQREDAGKPRAFRLEFGTRPASPAPPRLPESAVDTLVDNDGFERANTDGVPDGIAPAVFRRDFRRVEEGNGHALAYNADPEGHGPAFTTPWVSVRERESYTLSFRYCARNAEAHPRYKLILFSYANFRDAAGKNIPRASLFSMALGDTGGWKEFRATLPMPAGARSVSLEVRNGSKIPYAVLIDDVRIARAAPAQVAAAQTADGRRVTLRVEDANVRRFDLGKAGSPVWEGFQALIPDSKYSPEQGFGFTRLDRPEAADRTRPEALTRDFVSALRADLRVDLPDGDYALWLLAGDSQVGSTVYWIYRDQRLTVNGAEVLGRDIAPARFFGTTYLRHYADFWRPGMDYYDTFIAPHFEEHTFPATVAGGKLLLSWRNLPVAALVIAPKARAGEMNEEIARLRADRKRATRIEELPGPREDPPALTANEHARGFVVFRRPASERVFPGSRPRPEERLSALRVFAAPGTDADVHFSLLPLRDLGDLRVRATDLRASAEPGAGAKATKAQGSAARAGSAGAGRIPAAAVDVRVVRYIFRSMARGESAAYCYQVAPFLLDRRESVPTPAEVAWTWWATVRVPEGTPARVYEGALEITPAKGSAFRLPLAVRVLPFRLETLPVAQGYYYFPSEPWYSTFWGANVRGPRYTDDPEVRKVIAENERRELRFMQSLGLNSVAFGDDLRGDLVREGERVRLKPGNRLAFWMDLYKEAGMGPMPFYGFQPIGAGNNLAWIDREGLKEQFTPQWNAAFRSLVEDIQQAGKERGWPEILWYISDELSNHGEEGAKMGVELAKALKGMPGVRSIASMNGPWEQMMVPHLNISMPNIAFPITDETIAKVRAAGSQLWLYNCGEERLNLGLYPWRVAAGGRFQWHYRYINAAPWDDQDGGPADSHYCLSLPGPDGPVPSLQARIVRAAVDDHRYVATLEKAVAAAKGNPKKRAAVAKAEQFLADLRGRVPVDMRVLVGYQVDPRAAGASLGGEFKNTDNLDRVRWATAQLVMELAKSEP